MDVIVNTGYTEPGYTAIDNLDGNITAKVLVTGTVNANKTGQYILTYSVSDMAGNAASTTRTVNVIELSFGGGFVVIQAIPEAPAAPATPANPGENPGTPAAPAAPASGENNNPVPPSVLGASTFIFSNDLKIGMQGNDVLELQRVLQSLGLFNGPLTGYFGQLTLAAVKKYQKANGIIQTGYVGPLTRAKLNAIGGLSNDNSDATALQSRIQDLQSKILEIQNLIKAMTGA
jgi:hypothetical protein